ncbi:204_t:CDS:2 [Racocetra persica]|uniref:204_t:CDS:1 n=1 Tax=Racocetra persica TaxID=160502 RepID=A0ACA9KTC5_9GLOM|nr:204_t:CDS:2 [Racocetra persica]
MCSYTSFAKTNKDYNLQIGSEDTSIKKGELPTNIIKNKIKVSIPIDQDEEVMTTSNSDYTNNDKQNKKPTQFTNVNNIIDNNISGDESEIPNLTDFDKAYHKLDLRKMWKLKSGTVVEKIIYEYAQSLSYESCLHSFIINNTDEEAKSLFSKKDWDEIFLFKIKKIPKIDKSIINLMKKRMVSAKYMGPLIDSAFRNSNINLIRVDGMSRASSDRKNQENHKPNCKKIRRKRDRIFKLKRSRLEFRAIKAGRK